MPHSRLASPTATLAVLQERGLATRKALGQHFLVDDNIIGRILALAGIGPHEAVLEVGPGIGTLTLALCAAAGHVVAVERDDRLAPQLASVAEECGNLTLVADDAVSVPPAALCGPLGAPVALVANLPYGVAATVVLRYFQELPGLQRAIVMVQAEVASRMTATPGGKEYGAYSVKLQLLAEPSGRFPVPRACFLPPPRVDSAVVRLDRRPDGIGPERVERASRAAEAAFAQRRKTLRNSVRSTLGCTSAELDAALDAAGIDGSRRAETLSVDEFLTLADSLHEYRLLP